MVPQELAHGPAYGRRDGARWDRHRCGTDQVSMGHVQLTARCAGADNNSHYAAIGHRPKHKAIGAPLAARHLEMQPGTR